MKRFKTDGHDRPSVLPLKLFHGTGMCRLMHILDESAQSMLPHVSSRLAASKWVSRGSVPAPFHEAAL